MKASVRVVSGPWKIGCALDKHSVSSTYIGDNEHGHPMFNTLRTEIGEAVYQLKYRQDWSQVDMLAAAVVEHAIPLLPSFGFIVPMPASTMRARQPVSEVASSVGKKIGVPVFHNLLNKQQGGQSLKNLNSKEDKVSALSGAFSISDEITNSGRWNVLLFDDLYHTGASAEAATQALLQYPKVSNVFFVSLTWR